MGDAEQRPSVTERMPTGIPGFDQIVRGGLFRGSAYVVSGAPGTGKTILGNQLCFHHAGSGGRVVYLTLLTESHGRMLANLQTFDFFDQAPLARTLYYLSGYRVLEDHGLRGLLDFIQRSIREHRASLLVIDDMSTAEGFAESQIAFKRFLHDLRAFGEVTNCALLLLTILDTERPRAEYAVVDGLIELTRRVVGQRGVREIEVQKFRGSESLQGRHLFGIDRTGVVVHPRSEAVLATPPPAATEARRRLAFGIPRLDEMLRGGILSSSATMLFGSPGSGKTLLGLHFLAEGARNGEQALHFGFYEPPPRLIGKAEAVGLDLGTYVRGGRIEIVWQPPLEQIVDALVEQILDTVRRRGVRRLFIDGLSSFEETAVYPERFGRLFAALTNELRALDVTTLFALETKQLFGPAVELPSQIGVSTIENIIFLRYVELRSQLYRLVSMLKVRESDYDSSIREFHITAHGIDVADTFESAEAILTGLARPLGPPPTAEFRSASHGGVTSLGESPA